MTVSEQIKTIDTKIEQNKTQCNLDKQATKISSELSGNVSKHEFLTGKDDLPEEDLLEKAAPIKSFQYSPLGSELKKQTDIAKKKTQKTGQCF